MLKCVVFDTETTGVPNFKLAADDPTNPRMASLAAILTDEAGNEVDSFYHLVKPEGWSEHVLDPENHMGAFRVNGLSMERLWDEGRPLVEVLEAYDAFVDECALIAAYGVHFDQKIVRGEQRRAGRNDRYGERPTFCVQQAATPICQIPPTAKMMAANRYHNKTPNLGEAVEIILGEQIADAHDALADTRYTQRIYQQMLRDGHVVPKEQISKR